jgi:hypothetical protein
VRYFPYLLSTFAINIFSRNIATVEAAHITDVHTYGSFKKNKPYFEQYAGHLVPLAGSELRPQRSWKQG